MDSQHNAGIRISGDAAGAVDATKQVADEQKKLVEQTKRSTESVKAAAEESKRFVERMKEQAETVGKSRAEAERYRASQLQLTDAQKRSVDASIRQIEAYDKKQQALHMVRRAAAVATVALVAVTAAATAGTKHAIDHAAALHNLSQSYGVSTETLSAYQYQMGLAGVGQQEFNLATKALIKNIGEARAGVGDGAALFKLLGRDIEGAVRSGASLEKLVPMIAERISSFGDGVNKTNLMLALFGGRVGEKLVPEMNKGAQGFRDAAKEAQQFGQIIGPGFAQRAEQFNTNLARSEALLKGITIQLAEGVLPELNKLLEIYLRGGQEGGASGGVWALLKELAARGWKGMVSPVWGAVDAIQTGSNRRTEQNELAALQAAMGDFATYSPKPDAPALPKTGGKTAAQIMAEVSGVNANFTDELRALHAEYANGAIRLETYQAAVVRLIMSQQAAQEMDRNWAEAIKARNDAAGELVKGSDAQLAAREDLQRAGVEQARQLQFEISLVGQLETQVEMANAMRGIELELRQAIAANPEITPEQLNALREDMEIRKRRIAVLIEERQARQAGTDAQDGRIRAALDQQRSVDDQAARSAQVFEQAVATGIMLGFRRGGSNLGQQLRRLIEDSIATAMLTPIATRIGGPFGQVGQFLSGQGSMAMQFGNYFATSRIGQAMGMSSLTEDAAGNVTRVANTGAAATAASYIPYVGAAIMAASVMQSRQSRREFDALPRDWEAELGMSGSRRARYNPFGAYMAGDISFGDMAKGMLAPGLFSSDGLAMRVGGLTAGFGQGGIFRNEGWFSDQMVPGLTELASSIATREQNLIRNLNLSPEQVGSVNAALAPANARQYAFGMEHTDWLESGAAEQIQADRLNAISQALGKSIEQLTRIMALSAEEFAEIERQLQNQLADVTESFGGFIRSLPGRLGITAIEDAQNALAVSEYYAPQERLAAARGIYDSTLARARAGDLGAVSEFPQAAQQLLGIGRDVYASGPQFQELFAETNRALNEVLEQQRSLQTEILKDVPVAIMEASRDQVSEIKRQTTTLLEALERVENEIRLLRAA
jgi:hypothetical protein